MKINIKIDVRKKAKVNGYISDFNYGNRKFKKVYDFKNYLYIYGPERKKRINDFKIYIGIYILEFWGGLPSMFLSSTSVPY